jgi:hypothetical protein
LIFVGSTLTDNAAGVVPVAAFTFSQSPPLAVEGAAENAVAAVLVTDTWVAAGNADPMKYSNTSDVGDTVTLGFVTLSRTATPRIALSAGALMTTVP